MLYGTELDDAYNMGTSLESNMRHATQPEYSGGAEQQQQAPAQTQQTVRQAQPPVHMQYLDHSQQQQQPVSAASKPQVIATQPQPPPQQRVVNYYRSNSDPGYSYFDNMVSKRRDVLKIIILAVTIVLGISVHAFVDFVLREMTVGKELDFKHELGLRLLYPALVILIIWLLKAIK